MCGWLWLTLSRIELIYLVCLTQLHVLDFWQKSLPMRHQGFLGPDTKKDSIIFIIFLSQKTVNLLEHALKILGDCFFEVFALLYVKCLKFFLNDS